VKHSRRTDADADETFQAITHRLLTDNRVAQARMFGASGLSVNGKYFAMLYKGNLVVKLPETRASQVVAGGDGQPFDPGHGRVMREWVAVHARRVNMWDRYVAEALSFVASAIPSARTRQPARGAGVKRTTGPPRRK
jgi:hypothetical protein